ncbi:beta strand repeat-containing protein, partial [Anaerobiospirillum succiniciproducens]|uniref:beta strand repeat-containing protein n=1 Tax=Anaerobiospirillum succiniciproducens TaxID=13335 RepID=UPI0005C6713F
MKQTNNAIKFLMAQYRAIFKHANIAMVTAMAAAALAAGQAQAATDQTLDNQVFKDDAALNVTITGAATADTDKKEYKKFTITGDEGENGFTNTQENVLTVTGGKDADQSSSSFEGKTDNKLGVINLVNTTLKIEGSADAVADTKVAVGGSDKSVALTLKEVSVKKGTLQVGKDGGAQVASSLTANKITIGGDGPAELNAKKAAVITGTKSIEVKKGGTVGLGVEAQLSGASLTVTDGALKLGDKSKVINSAINVSGGTVTLSGKDNDNKSELGNSSSNIKITGGEVKVDDGKHGVITASSFTLSDKAKLTNSGSLAINTTGTIELSGGTIDNADQKSLTFGNVTNIKSGSTVTNSGTLVFAKGGSIDDNATFKNTANSGNTKVHIGTGTLSVSSKALKDKLLTGDEVSTTNDAKAIIQLTDSGDAALNLGDATIIGAANGIVNAKFKKQGTNGTLTIQGNNAEYKGNDVITGQDGVNLSFKNFTVGKGNTDNVTLKSGSITVSESLKVPEGKGLILDSGNALVLDGTTASGSIVAKSVTVGSGKAEANLNVDKGTWTLPALTITNGAATVEKDAQLKVNGALKATTEGALVVKGGLVSTEGADGKLVLKGAAAKTVQMSNGATLIVDADEVLNGKTIHTDFAANSISGDGSSIIEVKGGEKLSRKEFETFYTATGFKGIFKMDVDTGVTAGKGEIELKDIVVGLQTNDFVEKTLVLSKNESVSGGYSLGDIKIKAAKAVEVKAGGSLILNSANATTGNFVTMQNAEGKDVTGDVSFADAKNSLSLIGTGNIGSVTTANATSKGKVVIGMSDEQNTKAGAVTVVSGSNLGDNTNRLGSVVLNKNSSLDVKSGSVFADNFNMLPGTSVDVNGDITTNTLTVSGKSLKANTLTIDGAAGTDGNHINGGANVEVSKLVLAEDHKLAIGEAGTDETNVGSSAQIYTDTLVLKEGASLFLDPAYGQAASLLVAQDYANDITTGPNVDELKGKIVIGQNSALGLGFTKTEFSEVMADYLTVNGGFDKKSSVKNALVLNKPLKIADTYGILVDYEQVDPKKASAGTNEVKIANGSALILTDKAFGANKDQAAIQFKAATGTLAGDANSGSKVILLGDFDASDTNLMLASQGGGSSSAAVTGKINVEAAGGLLHATIDDGNISTFALTINDEKKALAYDGVSKPIGDLIIDKVSGKLTKGSTGYGLLSDLIAAGNYKAVDAAAHAATYAGAQQAAVAAVTTMADAMFGRVGAVGVEAASISATGSQANGGVWLTPMYKSVDSDGFNAEGASYGADVDLSGVAFGTDTVNGNMRFGAVFNIGSGDA